MYKSFFDESGTFLGIISLRVRHPQSQDSVEQSNQLFMQALLVWMMYNNDKNRIKYGMCVTNAQLNRCPSRVKADHSPNQIFYGKRHDKLSIYNVMDLLDLLKVTQTEAVLEATYNVILGNKNVAMIPN